MPEIHDQVEDIEEMLESLRCDIDLPASWADFFEQAGSVPSAPEDKRRFPRSYLRVSGALEYRQSLPGLTRAKTWYRIYAKDVSRCGLSFVHGEQLFPREQMRIILPDGKLRMIEVMRCRHIQERCFDIGANFVQGFRT